MKTDNYTLIADSCLYNSYQGLKKNKEFTILRKILYAQNKCLQTKTDRDIRLKKSKKPRSLLSYIRHFRKLATKKLFR